ncbi:MAG: hydroxymethylpyrimidine/phosphomethylpyrimidine kinase, partial [Polyangiales bacterium]
MTRVVLTVAGSDPSGGAGLQADLKTFSQHRVYGAAIPTVITVQNTNGVIDAESLSPSLVRAQLEAVLGDLAPAAAKTGALGSPEVVHEVAAFAARTAFPWVVDPVLSPTLGTSLSTADLTEPIRASLVPVAALMTPNAEEASALSGKPVRTLREAAAAAA